MVQKRPNYYCYRARTASTTPALAHGEGKHGSQVDGREAFDGSSLAKTVPPP